MNKSYKDKSYKEKLTDLLTSFGVAWREKPEGIKCEGFNEYDKIAGYGGFYTLFEFDESRSFIAMGAWE